MFLPQIVVQLLIASISHVVNTAMCYRGSTSIKQ